MWAGKVERIVGNGRLVAAIGYQTDEVRTAIERMLDGLGDATSREYAVQPVFGVRPVKTGLLRRTTWLVSFGSEVRHRAAQLAEAVEFLRGLLLALSDTPEDGEVAISGRAFVRGDDVVIVEAGAGSTLDERKLVRAGIRQLPTSQVFVRPTDSSVRSGDRRYALRGFALAAADRPATLAERRRRLWARHSDLGDAWAWLVDRLGPGLVDDASSSRLRELLSG